LRRIRQLVLLLGRVKTIWIIFLLGLTIRVGITLWLGNRLLPLADQPVFLDMAENIATGHGLSVSSKVVGMPENISDSLRAVLMTRPERMRDERLGALWGVILPDKPTAFFEPFYPFFVGGIRWIFGPTSGTHLGSETIPFGPKITIVRLFQSLFDALVIPILFYLGSALFTPVVGGLAGLIYCFYPYSIVFVTNIVTQNTYLFLQAVMVFFFVRTMKNQNWFNYLALGLTAGLTLLTRISLITFIPFIIICLYLPLRRNLKWGRLAVSLAIMVAAVIPWLIRNNAVFGEPLLLPTKGGRNLWEYNNQIFTPEKMEGRFTGVDALYQRFAKANYDQLKAKELIAFPEFTTETEPERDRILNERVQGFIKANPVVYAKLCGLRLYQLFRVIPRHLGGPLATLAALLSFGWILPACLLGLALSLKGPWQERSVLYGLIFYTVATSTLTASGIPHRLPTDPYLIMLAAFCVVYVFKLEPSK
jgi:4-amino-4-deoxy-L-arabinose transferase-like glycosyltransferase